MAARTFSLIPDEIISHQQISTRETTGQRGKPDFDFDILNAIQSDTQSRLGALQSRAQVQHEDLSTILENVNVLVRDTQKRKRDSDLMFANQADDLALKSDQLRQKAMEAAADPFNDLKALFGNTPSMAEWAAQHNAVQNELFAIKRRFTSSTAGYNFDLNEAAQDISFAVQKLAMTEKNISSIAAASQAITTQIQTRSVMFTQQLDTMHTRAELQAELDDPNGEIPKDLVRRRLATLDLAKAELTDALAKAGKSKLEQAKALFDVLDKHPEFIPEWAVKQALQTNKSVHVPILGISITPQMAKVLFPKQLEQAQVGAKLLSEITRNTLSGRQAFGQVVGIFQRLAGPGTSVLGRDAQGNALGFNVDALSEDMKRDAATMFDLQSRAHTLQLTLADPSIPPGQLREQTRLLENQLNRRAMDLRDELVKRAKIDAQLGVVGKQAKESAGRWAELGIIKSDAGAQQLLAEGAIAVIPGTEGKLSTAHGAGWGDGMVVLGTTFNAEIISAGSLFTKDGEEREFDMDKILTLQVRGVDVNVLAIQKALGQTKLTASGQTVNLVQATILSDWYEIALNRGIRELEESHAAEPETIAMLQKLRLGTIALALGITTMKDEKGELLDTANVLFATLALEEKVLRKAGTLPETSTLVHELQSLMLGDIFGDPEKGKSLYDLPEILSLAVPTTKEGASLNWVLFRNKAFATFRAGLQNIVGSVPLGDFDLSAQITEKEAAIKRQILDKAPTIKLGSKQQKLRQLTDELEALRQQEGSRSLTGIMQQILSQQE